MNIEKEIVIVGVIVAIISAFLLGYRLGIAEMQRFAIIFKTPKEENFYYMFGEKIKVDNWEIIINEVKRADYIITQETFDPTYGELCKPKKENYDFFIVNILIKNIGKKREPTYNIEEYSIVTIEDYVYEKADYDLIKCERIDELIKKYPQALIINELYRFKELDPEEEYNAWIIFTLPKDKIVKEITFNVREDYLRKIIHVKL